MDVLLFPLYVLAMVVASFLSVGLARWIYRRQRARRRVVERPNSHYTSDGVRRNETRNRWRGIDRSQLHEINRAEVDRLLARVEAAGPECLRTDERRFLDYLFELTAGTAAEPLDEAADDAPESRPGGGGGPTGAHAVADAQGG